MAEVTARSESGQTQSSGARVTSRASNVLVVTARSTKEQSGRRLVSSFTWHLAPGSTS